MTVSKGELTRDWIIRQAAVLFNTRGFANTSIQDIMAATGLKKGGIYNHFQSKQEITLLAFTYAFDLVRQRIRQAVAQAKDNDDRFESILRVYEDFVRDPPLPGGCPLLNAATEVDDADADPELHRKVRSAMDYVRKLWREAVRKGVAEGELRADVDPGTVATVALSLLEGAVMLSRLYRDDSYLRQGMMHLREYLNSLKI